MGMIYPLPDGTEAARTTQVLDILAKPALIEWANKEGLAGRKLERTKRNAMDTGTLLHAMVLAEITGEELSENLKDYTPNMISDAENALIKFYDWQTANPFEVIFAEKRMVHDDLRYGGTCDLVCKFLNTGKIALCDWKTSNGIWDEYIYQLAAYRELVRFNYPDIKIDECHVIRFGKDDVSTFEDRIFTNLDNHLEVFLHALKIYQLKKKIKGDK